MICGLVGLLMIVLPASLIAHNDKIHDANNSLCEDEIAKKTALHSFADLRCCLEPGRNVQECLDHRLANFAGDRETRTLLDKLATESAQDTRVERTCHEIVHAIGRRAFERTHNIGTAINECTTQCQAGCYHGTIERMFFADAEDTGSMRHITPQELRTKIRTACSVVPAGLPEQAFHIQCSHGLGHALLYTFDYQLQQALESCDLLRDIVDQRSCYLGVFMENVIGKIEGDGDLKEDDPLYPCTVVSDKYKESCYKQQTKVMIFMGKTPAQIARLCSETGAYRKVCFEGLGRDTSEPARTGDAPRIAHICEDNAGTFVSDCVGGAARALVDFSWNARHAYRYCSALTQGEVRSRCFSVAQSHLRWAYGQDQQAIEEGCRLYAGPETIRCFLAAGTGNNAPWWRKIFTSFFTP